MAASQQTRRRVAVDLPVRKCPDPIAQEQQNHDARSAQRGHAAHQQKDEHHEHGELEHDDPTRQQDRRAEELVELRQQVEKLLQSDEQAGSFLEKPPAELDATIVCDTDGVAPFDAVTWHEMHDLALLEQGDRWATRRKL